MSPADLERIARELARREAGRGPARDAAHRRATWMRERMEDLVKRFHEAAAGEGAAHLGALVEIGAVEPDDKSVRAFQFTLRRGRYEGIVVSKDRQEIMLVGPYRRYQEEGPCNPVQLTGDRMDDVSIEAALEAFLLAFIEQAFAK
ncbi:MAG: hypothetical protein ACREAA_06335 [Candidatus Polarisedimenticolia bacterium]